jgi:hypothetical protein
VAGGTATWDELTVGRLKWGEIAETGAIAFVASGVGTKATGAAADSQWLSQLPVGMRTAMPHLVEGTTWAGAAAGDDALVNHRFSLLDVSESFVLAGGSTLGRDALRDRGMWPAEPDYRRQALINLAHRDGLITKPETAHELSLLRQSTTEIRAGAIDLRLHEGPGHTIDRHIGKTTSELLTRIKTSRIKTASSYWDDASANDTIGHAVAAHRGMVEHWIEAGTTNTLRMRVTVPYDVGFVVTRAARVTFVRQAIVVLRRDHTGIWLLTSYPIGHK